MDCAVTEGLVTFEEDAFNFLPFQKYTAMISSPDDIPALSSEVFILVAL
jgi:hypothetical protein